MIKNMLRNAQYVFSTIKSSFLPAMLFLCALTLFYANNPFAEGVPFILHCCFMFVFAFSMILLYLANQNIPTLNLLLGFVSYIIINQLRREHGADFTALTEFQLLCFLLPLNLMLLHYLPQQKLLRYQNLYIILFMLAQAAFWPLEEPLISYVPYQNIVLESMPLIAMTLWLAVLLIILIDASIKKSILNTGIFYADCALFMGILYAGNFSGFTVFFSTFTLILCVSSVLDLYHRYLYDFLEGVYSKNAYFSHANHKFPFKYTIAIFSLDNRDKLLQILGKNNLYTLEQMVINRIKEMPYEQTFYRYTEEEVILVFKNEDAKHVKEFADNIRRSIAISEFMLSTHKNLKITISLCVSEKTRKDLNATEVVERAHNALQKSYRFNCNVVTVA